MLIGFGHKARTGKDLAAEYLVKNYGFKRRAFADSLKNALREIMGFDDRHLYGELKEKIDEYWEITPRSALQLIGSECLRKNFREDVWVKSLFRHIRNNPSALHWVVPDVRFPNEVKAIQEAGGFVVKLERNTNIISQEAQQHISETALDNFRDWDYKITNEGTLEQFYSNLDLLIRDVRKR